MKDEMETPLSLSLSLSSSSPREGIKISLLMDETEGRKCSCQE